MKKRTATTGHWLTQATLADESSRIFVHEVAGYGDLDSLFTEWTDAQKEAWEAEHPTETEESA